jgi:hypothetical protein
MPRKDFKSLRIRALKYARQLGIDIESSEDFAQEYCLGVLTGKPANVIWAFADYSRKRFGRGGHKNYRSNELPLIEDAIASPKEIDIDRKLDIVKMLEFIPQIKSRKIRITLQLILYEVPQNLIAEILLLTDSRISQLYSEGIEELKQKFNEKIKESYESRILD